ncbi:MAG TPA: FGGY-family carbohydrate kinase, partial [Ktedonobacteraceae bacterium]|nr:FGGY-family carbohydrate kinase [Ktedonobacteraceae bacterium]
MSRDLVLGIDAGTASLRAGLFDLQGQPLGFFDQAYQTHYPQPGWAQQRPADWWNALVAAVQGCLAKSGVDVTRVIGLAIDAPCDILLTDQQGIPLTDSLMWMDLRASEQARQLTETRDPVLRYCGGDVPAEWPSPKALWLKQRQPGLWARASYLVEQMSWLTWRLTDERVIPLNSAAAKWHYRAHTDETNSTGWPVSLLRSVGLEDLPAKMSGAVLPMGTKAGELTRRAAGELGLLPGIAVSMSGIDAHAGMIGLDVLAPNSLALITGTSTCQLVQSPTPIADPGLWGPFEDAVVAGEWTIEAGQASTGGTVRWLLDTLGGGLPPGADRYSAADDLAAAVQPGAEGLTVLDFWQGSRTPIKDPRARGTIWGLTPAHSVGHLLRAVYEGTAYGNRRILEKLAELGVSTKTIIACGGGTRSALWLQILADVAGVPITLTTEPDAVTLGSAICAAVGSGAFTDLHTAAQSMVHAGKTVEPSEATRAVYDEGYDRYKATYDALQPLFQR